MKATIKDVASPSFVAIRQQHHYFLATTEVKVDNLSGAEAAGIVLIQNNAFNLRVEANGEETKAILCEKMADTVLSTVPTKNLVDANGVIKLSVKVEGLTAKVFAAKELLGEVSISTFSTEVAGGFVGCTVGMYASANGTKSNQYACFKNFAYTAE